MSLNKSRINPKTGELEIQQVQDCCGVIDEYKIDKDGYLLVTSKKADRQSIDKSGNLIKEFKKGRII